MHTQSSLMKAAERPRRQTGATSSDPASNVAANEETPSSEVCGMGGWVGGWEEPLGVCVGGWVVGGGWASGCLSRGFRRALVELK